MKIDRYALKTDAKAALRRARPKPALMTLLYLALTGGLSLVVSLFVEDPLLRVQTLLEAGLDPVRSFLLAFSGIGMLGMFLSILLFIFGVVMDFGYSWWILGTSRGGIGEYADLISGFSMAGRVLLLRLVVSALEFGWYLIIFMVAAAAGLALMLIPVLGVVLTAVLLITAAVLYASRVLRYSMAVYCLADDPEAGVMAAIRRSVKLMRGNCGAYVLLLLSFIGWQLLGALIVAVVEGVMVFALGGAGVVAALFAGNPTALNTILSSKVGMIVSTLATWPLSLWLTPYVAMTEAMFYNRLRSAQPQEAVQYRYQ